MKNLGRGVRGGQPKRWWAAAALILVLPWATGCSVIARKLTRSATQTVQEASIVFATDEDPELVRDALPFLLKSLEAALIKAPKNRELLLAACSTFTQYSYAFVDTDAFLLEDEDFRRSRELKERALALYLRGRESCKKALELTHPGMWVGLVQDPEAAVQRLGPKDLDLMYWTAASWGAAIALGQDRPELTADLPAVRALLERALELDEDYQDGALHQAMMPLAALPETMGGSEEEARRHFQRSLELSDKLNAAAYVTLARTVAVANQDRQEFEELLDAALAVDVDQDVKRRLANLIAQRQARELQKRVDDLFFLDPDAETADPEL